jgi:hypothetical protein
VSDRPGAGGAAGTPAAAERRAAKFRQAAFVYLHLAVLYEATVYAMLGPGLLPTRFGPPWMWLVVGAVVAGSVFVGLLRWQNAWLARAVWVFQALRLPGLIGAAFFPESEQRAPTALYLTAVIAIVITMWMLARAGWDL